MIQAGFIDETGIPLEFANHGRHVDIRYGIMNYGVLDSAERENPKEIKIGMIGTAPLIAGLLEWLDKSGGGVNAKKSKHPNLFPRFPGFGDDSPFNAHWVCDPRSQRSLSPNDIADLSKQTTAGGIVQAAVELYVAEIRYLSDETKPDMVFCIVPDTISEHLDRAAELAESTSVRPQDEDTKSERYRHDFHDMLKAQSMGFHIPTQIISPSTFDKGKRGKATKKKRPHRKQKARVLQDPATRAWNLFTSMYYKTGGAPWRLVRDANDYQTCYIGISFFKTLNEEHVMTSIAQVFNERGEGIVIRGGKAVVSKEDRTPHLSETDAAGLLANSLKQYRAEHKTLPARVVLHKSSYFSDAEISGFQLAIQNERIELIDMVSIRDSNIRLFRDGDYPALRGTFLDIDDQTALLYTRGSVPFFQTYPGMYIPRAKEIRLDCSQEPSSSLCREILELTKMNWNSTQFDMSEPITLHAARMVGKIMKYVPAEMPEANIAGRYCFYM